MHSFAKTVIFLLLPMVCLAISGTVSANYGAKKCKESAYKCVTPKRGDSWYRLFPNSHQRNLVMKLNRVNTRLRPGRVIAVPKNLAKTKMSDIRPFPAKIEASKRGKIFVNQREFAWAAYDKDGKLLRWGPMSGGRDYCADIKGPCDTPPGEFTVFRMGDAKCKSKTFPVGKGGSPMPYCAFFNGGIAFHGSNEVPGYHASHGCVRMNTSDARWLNTKFIKIGVTKVFVDVNMPKGVRSNVSSWRTNWNDKGAVTGFEYH